MFLGMNPSWSCDSLDYNLSKAYLSHNLNHYNIKGNLAYLKNKLAGIVVKFCYLVKTMFVLAHPKVIIAFVFSALMGIGGMKPLPEDKILCYKTMGKLSVMIILVS